MARQGIFSREDDCHDSNNFQSFQKLSLLRSTCCSSWTYLDIWDARNMATQGILLHDDDCHGFSRVMMIFSREDDSHDSNNFQSFQKLSLLWSTCCSSWTHQTLATWPHNGFYSTMMMIVMDFLARWWFSWLHNFRSCRSAVQAGPTCEMAT